MSFVERNKAWLLPLLGVGVLGVVWMNLQTFKPKKAPAKPTPPAATPSPLTPAAAPAPAPVPPPAPHAAPPAHEPGASGVDLWSDLRPLEPPAPTLAQADEMLKEGARPLDLARIGQRPEPELDPLSWRGLPEPHFPKAVVAAAQPKTPSAAPKLELILEGPDGAQEAWFRGRPYREGQSPDGVHRIKQIRRWSVVLSGPNGEIRLSTELGRAKAGQPAVAAEAM